MTYSFEPPERSSVKNAEEVLDRMMDRLEQILLSPKLSPDEFVEITAIFNNVSYLFLYLEANGDDVQFEHLLARRDAFYKNRDLDKRIERLLQMSIFDDPRLKKSREAYLEQLAEKKRPPGPEIQIAGLKDRIKNLEVKIAEKRARHLEKLGCAIDLQRPQATYYSLMRGTEDVLTRQKLNELWSLCASREEENLATLVDEMLTARWMAAETFQKSPIEITLSKCSVDEQQVVQFLFEYTERAVTEQKKLEEEISRLTGFTKMPVKDFGRYLRLRYGDVPIPLFSLEACLDFIFEVTGAWFGFEFKSRTNPTDSVIVSDAYLNGEYVGRIHFDLWSNRTERHTANHTLGIRNRTNWSNIVQKPEAWVACRFMKGHTDERLITFQNVHSLYHEFGHAINHLLIKEEIPNQSGLEYLPLERLELMSMWFEKWVYHPAFADAVLSKSNRTEALTLCQDIKKLEYRSTFVERALSAALDYQCHTQQINLRDSYRSLEERFDLKNSAQFFDYPPYFAWPMYIANPGASFIYLWGAAWSCAAFSDETMKQIKPVSSKNAIDFSPCFDVSRVAPIPEPASVFKFYG